KKWGGAKIRYIESENDFPSLQKKKKDDEQKQFHPVIIDALFGSGLNKPLEGLAAQLVAFLNAQIALRIAADIPSGLFADHVSEGKTFQAHHTITFQHPKRSFVFAQNYDAVGEFHVADIGLDEEIISSFPLKDFLL